MAGFFISPPFAMTADSGRSAEKAIFWFGVNPGASQTIAWLRVQ
jgi:hypothetical protein